MLVFEQGHLSRKNLPRPIFASVNYLTSALVKENLTISIYNAFQTKMGFSKMQNSVKQARFRTA